MLPARAPQPAPARVASGQICPERLYTLAGLRTAGGINAKHLRAAINLGYLPSFYVGRLTYCKGADVIHWMETHCHGRAPRVGTHPLR